VIRPNAAKPSGQVRLMPSAEAASWRGPSQPNQHDVGRLDEREGEVRQDQRPGKRKRRAQLARPLGRLCCGRNPGLRRPRGAALAACRSVEKLWPQVASVR
jgi:hypothetical protein